MFSRKWIRLIYLILFLLISYLLLRRKPTISIENEPVSSEILVPETGYDLDSVEFITAPNHPTLQYYSNLDSVNVKEITSNRQLKIDGFQFCKILNGGLFDTLVPIRDLGGSIATINPDKHDFVNMIDGRAYDIYQAILRKFHLANQKEVKRISCYTAAEGQTVVANMTHGRLMTQIDPISYFTEVLPAIVPTRSSLPGTRRKFKLAYLVMVHDKSGFKQLCKLLELIDDGNAIILVHVDARKQSQALYDMLFKWIHQRSGSNSFSSIYLAKHRFSNIWGHISLVFTQLSGFWELLDLADWDYVINLSNYDYPIKLNKQIHAYLSNPKYKGMNFIEYWQETSDLAERFYRVHLGLADFSSLYHPSEMGVVTWPYTNWRAYKHHQWVILTPEAIQFLRTNVKALTFLAFAEHTYIPDESYFATVLVNSPEFNGKILNDNKRYLRFVGGAHPSWLGFPDRHLFPPYEEDASFYFIRKFNVLGTIFDEGKLVDWIEEHHYKDKWEGDCKMEYASVRPECLKHIVKKVAYNNQVIVIPVNLAMHTTAQNLLCSLNRLKITNIVFWALDLEVYEELLLSEKPVLIVPGLNPMPDLQKSKARPLIQVMRSKPKILELLLDTGVDVWFLDADTVVLKDFRNVQDLSVDVYLGMQLNLERSSFVVSGAIMFFRNTVGSRNLLEMYRKELGLSSLLDDEDALRRIVHRPKLVRTLDPNLKNMYSRSTPRQSDLDESIPTIRYLDHYAFISGTVFEKPSRIPAGFEDFYILHSHNPAKMEGMLRSFGVWFVGKGGNCVDVKNVNFHFS